MRPYAVYVPLCVKAIISNFILYLKRKVAHNSQSSTKTPADTKPQQVCGVIGYSVVQCGFAVTTKAAAVTNRA